MELTHHHYPKVTWQHAMRRSLTLSLILPSFYHRRTGQPHSVGGPSRRYEPIIV